MALKKRLLRFFLEDSLRDYSEDFILYNVNNPVRFSLNGKKYSIHISYVHDSGKNRTNDDEARIQIQRNVIQEQLKNSKVGYSPIFIGFYEKGTVFVAWPAKYIFSLSFETTGSVYARKSHFDKVNDYGADIRKQPVRNLQEDTTIIALPGNALGLYLENSELFHKVEEETDLQTLVQSASKLIDKTSKYSEEQIDYKFLLKGRREKKTIISKRIAYSRNPKFTRDVIQAYNGQCAICKKQLNIVQAAHIVPHSHDRCQDTVNNGIALCVEHHALYDSTLLLPDKDKKLFLNEERVLFLKEINQTNGLDAIKERSEYEYDIPQQQELQPLPENLEIGIKIRLGKID